MGEATAARRGRALLERGLVLYNPNHGNDGRFASGGGGGGAAPKAGGGKGGTAGKAKAPKAGAAKARPVEELHAEARQWQAEHPEAPREIKPGETLPSRQVHIGDVHDGHVMTVADMEINIAKAVNPHKLALIYGEHGLGAALSRYPMSKVREVAANAGVHLSAKATRAEVVSRLTHAVTRGRYSANFGHASAKGGAKSARVVAGHQRHQTKIAGLEQRLTKAKADYETWKGANDPGSAQQHAEHADVGRVLAERIRAAERDLAAARGLMLLGSPGQPRDDHGRWTSGGGVSSAHGGVGSGRPGGGKGGATDRWWAEKSAEATSHATKADVAALKAMMPGGAKGKGVGKADGGAKATKAKGAGKPKAPKKTPEQREAERQAKVAKGHARHQKMIATARKQLDAAQAKLAKRQQDYAGFLNKHGVVAKVSPETLGHKPGEPAPAGWKSEADHYAGGGAPPSYVAHERDAGRILRERIVEAEREVAAARGRLLLLAPIVHAV